MIMLFFMGLALVMASIIMLTNRNRDPDYKSFRIMIGIIGLTVWLGIAIISITIRSNYSNVPVKYKVITTKVTVTPADTVITSIDTTYTNN